MIHSSDLNLVNAIFKFFDQNFSFKFKGILIINEENLDFKTGVFSSYLSKCKTVYIVQNDFSTTAQEFDKSQVSLFSVSSMEFLKLATETATTFDFVIYFVSKQRLKEFKIAHQQIVNQILDNLLKKSGIFVIVFEFEGEVLTEYPISKLFRRMSDNLTKKIFGKTLTNICVHVFYK